MGPEGDRSMSDLQSTIQKLVKLKLKLIVELGTAETSVGNCLRRYRRTALFEWKTKVGATF